MNKEDMKVKKQLVDEMLKLAETNPDVMTYMDALMKCHMKLQYRIDKVRELIENDYFEDGSFENYYEVMRLLKGE